jgi:hypothetical protein
VILLTLHNLEWSFKPYNWEAVSSSNYLEKRSRIPIWYLIPRFNNFLETSITGRLINFTRTAKRAVSLFGHGSVRPRFLWTLFYTLGLEIVVLHVMVRQPYRFSPCFLTYLKQVMVSLPYIKIYFFKTLIALKLKSLWVWLKFSLIHNKFLGRYAKNWIFHQNNILQYFFSKSVHGYLTMWCVK